MAYANVYRPDRLFLPQQKLAAFAKTVPTPFYLYSEDRLRKAANLIRGSFCWAPAHMPWFPMSANGCPAVLRIFREEGFGALARSVRELTLAQEMGFSEIAFHIGAMTDEAALAASGAGTVIFDAPGQIEALRRLPERCMLRVLYSKSGPAFQLRQRAGLDREQVAAAVRRLQALGAKQIGLHCHVPSGGSNESFYPSVASGLFALAKEVYQLTGVKVRCIDLGGGIGAAGEQSVRMVQLSRVGALVRDLYENELPADLRPEIHTELGRYAAARHGLLITRVAEVRERARTYAILDASTAHLPDVLLGVARHPISVVGNCAKTGRRVYSVHGCTPDARERICDRAILPALAPGSLLAIHYAGAYCESMQLPRTMLPKCGSYLYTRDGRFVPTA